MNPEPLPIFKRPQVLVDIWEATEYLLSESLDAGLKFLDATETTFDLLAKNPEIGRDCEFPHSNLQNIQRWPLKGFPKHLLFYFVRSDHLEIIRLIHSSRDINKILK